ncbi:MAG: nicotinate-nucleotide adenylyltransferase [Chloroflexi bacterium]|nr:nicotinate-nucleotide adenylyltransferase [Chloroflexota bacterium]
MPERLGVFGGTFDPPHIAHQIVAERAQETLSLDKVMWVPVGDPPHKKGQQVLEAVHRLHMVEHAVAGNPHFAIARIDIDRPGPHYSVDMLRLLSDEYPTAELFFLIGGDSLRDISQWHQPERLIECATLVVVERPGVEYDFDALTRAIPGLEQTVVRIDVPCIEVSSTDIRERAAAGRSIRYLVPSPVADYIHEHALYAS